MVSLGIPHKYSVVTMDFSLFFLLRVCVLILVFPSSKNNLMVEENVSKMYCNASMQIVRSGSIMKGALLVSIFFARLMAMTCNRFSIYSLLILFTFPRRRIGNGGCNEGSKRQNVTPKVDFVRVVEPAISRLCLWVIPWKARLVYHISQDGRGSNIAKNTSC